ncbi:MAG: hybrid sensor histidine kinase/response regulator [Anaerolineae bacterium]
MTDQTKILYIEDDPGSQLLVKRALTFAGYKVVVASRGLEGIDMAIKELPDLILTDINLPDLSGRELTTRLRADARFRKTPIVALTALSQAGEREKALAAGANGYLTKPVDVDKLPKQVERYLRGEKETVGVEALVVGYEAYNQEVVSRLENKLRELEENNAELRRLDKIKDDFIQLTAHELRTPLTLMYGYSRLIQESSISRQLRESSPELQTVINGLVSSIERMSGVINEILTVSRVASGKVELSLGPTNLAEIAERVVSEYGEVAKQRKLMISFNKAQWPVNMRSDAELLRLALSNVVGNAIKYTPDGGVINMISRSNASNVLVTVQDTGIGINKDDQQRIFDRFYTANKTQLHSTSKTAFGGGGLGLGLAICRGIIEAHGGRIWAESEGRDEKNLPGNTFYIDLPLQAHAPGMPNVSPNPTGNLSASSKVMSSGVSGVSSVASSTSNPSAGGSPKNAASSVSTSKPPSTDPPQSASPPQNASSASSATNPSANASPKNSPSTTPAPNAAANAPTSPAAPASPTPPTSPTPPRPSGTG